MTDQAETITALRARAEKAEAEVARLRGTLEYIDAQAKAGYPTVLSCIRANAEAALDDKWQATVSAAMATIAASRPDPAQPGLSGAKTAAERAVLDATMRLWWNNFTLPKSVADACAALDRITGAAPPAAGSAAGMGE